MTAGDDFGRGAKLPKDRTNAPPQRSSSFLACLSVAAFASAASAQAPSRAAERLAIGRIDWSGNIPQPLRRTLADRLVDGLKAVAFEVLKPGGRGARSRARRRTAPTTACWQQSAQSLGVSYLISAAVEEQEKTFAITLELISGRTGVVMGTNRERCEICGAEEVGEKMSLAAATLRTRLESLAQAPARFVIRTNPHGARGQAGRQAAGTDSGRHQPHRRPAQRGHRARRVHPARADHHRHQRRRRDAGPGSGARADQLPVRGRGLGGHRRRRRHGGRRAVLPVAWTATRSAAPMEPKDAGQELPRGV